MAPAVSSIADVNVYVAAFRADHPHHQRCAAWLEQQGQSPKPFGVGTVVLSGAMRVLTNPRIYVDPASTAEAMDFCQAVVNHRNAILVHPGPGHWGIFAGLVRSIGARHALIPDAWFAALAIEASCPWVSLDRDFARFPGLEWQQP